MKIVFFGTTPFAAKILESLINADREIVAIVTRPDRPRGRSKKLIPPEVKSLASERIPEVPIYQPLKASAEAFVETMQSHAPDLFVVVAYGEIIAQKLLDVPKICPINIHASLLPKYRGAAPMERALMAGEKETGITIIEMVRAMDAGDMLAREVVAIDSDTDYLSLSEQLCALACKMLPEVIDALGAGREMRKAQNQAEVTFASKPEPEERKINWKMGAEEIHNRVRALPGGCWCPVKIGDEEKRLKVLKTEVEMRSSPDEEDQALIACKTGYLRLLEVQLEGGKRMQAKDFFRGLHKPLKFL